MFYNWIGDLMKVSDIETRLIHNPKIKELGLKPLFIPLCHGMKISDWKEIFPCEVCPMEKFSECWGLSDSFMSFMDG